MVQGVPEMPRPEHWRVLFTTPTGLFWTSSYLAFGMLAWLTPNTVLDDLPSARGLADFVASLIPQIDIVTRLGGQSTGQVNRFVYSVAWSLTPVYAVVLAIQGYRGIRKHGCRYDSYGHWAAILLGCMLTMLLLLYWPVSGTGRGSAVLFRGDLVRAFYTPFMAFGPSLLGTAALLHTLCVFSRRARIDYTGTTEERRRISPDS